MERWLFKEMRWSEKKEEEERKTKFLKQRGMNFAISWRWKDIDSKEAKTLLPSRRIEVNEVFEGMGGQEMLEKGEGIVRAKDEFPEWEWERGISRVGGELGDGCPRVQRTAWGLYAGTLVRQWVPRLLRAVSWVLVVILQKKKKNALNPRAFCTFTIPLPYVKVSNSTCLFYNSNLFSTFFSNQQIFFIKFV